MQQRLLSMKRDRTRIVWLVKLAISVLICIFWPKFVINEWGQPTYSLLCIAGFICLLVGAFQLLYHYGVWRILGYGIVYGAVSFLFAEWFLDFPPSIAWLHDCVLASINITSVLTIIDPLQLHQHDKPAVRDTLHAYLSAVRDRDAIAMQSWLLPLTEKDKRKYPLTGTPGTWPDTWFGKAQNIKSQYVFAPAKVAYYRRVKYYGRVISTWRFFYANHTIRLKFTLYKQEDEWRIARVEVMA